MSLDVAGQFGVNLRRARRRAGLSQEELGSRASLHRTEIGLLERGARVPRIDTLIKVASSLGVRIDCALLDGITWTSPTTEAGGFKVKSRIELHEELMERAAALRAGQTETVDAVQLVHETRDALAERRQDREEEED